MPSKTVMNKRSKQGKNQTSSSRADLIFPVGRINRMIKQGRYSDSTGKNAGVFMAAILEYLTCEILELAGNAAAENKKKTITPRHLQLALRNDEELNKLMASITIAAGGVMPNVEVFLFGKKGNKSSGANQ